MPFNERRAFARVGSKAPISLLLEAKPNVTYDGIAKNISASGVAFETDAPLRLKDRIVVRLDTIFGPVTLTAVVLRKAGSGYGCRFVDMNPDTQSKIQCWLFPPFEP